MSKPSDYLWSEREGRLADAIWHLADTLPQHWALQGVHDVLNDSALPWVNKKIIWARDWITAMRERDLDGGVAAINQEFRSDYTAGEIGDVEHFYVAALLATLGGPTGGILLNLIGDTFWEMIVGPLRIAWAKHNAHAVLRNIEHNWNQLSGPDAGGATFGALFPFVK